MIDMSTFDTAIGHAWNDHAANARGVADRLGRLQALAADEAQLLRVIALAHHVFGAHLGAWEEGSDSLRSLRSHTAYRNTGDSGASVRRALGSLGLCSGVPPVGFDSSDEIRVHAMAAESLCDHDAARAAEQLQRALSLAEQSALPGDDPMHRALAVASNNLACTLEEKGNARTADDRALMILSAQTARRHWERAGTWLEVERAEYRLAMTWVQAGDLAQAREHAEQCIAIVEENAAPALEAFFGWEALGVVERAAGNVSAHARAIEHARAAFAALAVDDQTWCKESLDKLTSPAPG